jgi:hypothetical protein
MLGPRLVRFCVFVAAVQLLTADAWAYKTEIRLPLIGCRGHFAAAGTARFHVLRGEPKIDDQEELLIEIKNVPLAPGTILVVYVSDEVVGNITLNGKQSGSLKLTSALRKFVPPLDPGTSVMVKTVDGRLIMW